ncbi:alpha/beta-hydrolase [Trametes coccinea BRFM310]|uniref:Alpha/beta-hydrolase n=1 Tax=Trametes coccinea (strain BRFM310) TaxID=1353009 RepID=A0A1Y2I8I7_TRAC3|nr:alpha/beta-hydrolase [Trametes coccinea BRFM310]
MHHGRRAVTRAALVATCLAVAVKNVYAQPSRLNWGPCPESGPANLTCAYFSVPLDYHDISAGNGTLLVVKANATSGEPKGTIFMNPGGPGVSGLTSLATDGPKLMNHSGGVYDIISWDARGIGPYTYPGDVFCLSDEETTSFWNGSIETTGINWLGNFTNQTDLDHLYSQAPIIDAQYRAFGEKCLQGPNGTTLQYVGTAATVRDMVFLADALQGPGTPIKYWGLSYGTIVGVWFMNMFPDRVGNVILDGVLDATSVATEQSYKLWRDQVGSAEDVYNAFANACALAGPNECPLARFEGATGADVVDYISSAISASAVHDQPSASNVSLLMLRASVYGGLYQPQEWASLANDTLASEMARILHSNATPQAQHAMTKRATFSTSYTEPAVVCADSVDADPSLSMKDVFDEIVNVTRTVSRSFGAFWPIPWHRCLYWPVRAVERYQGPFNKTLANRVLVIGNAYDNATPFFEAQDTADVLGSQAALVKQNGFGHTSIYQYSTCTANIIQAYLANGTLPNDGLTVCEIDDFVELFPGVKSVSVTVDNTGTKE